LLAGPNYVLSVHREPIEFLTTLRERERAETELGALSAESFVASLLDWQISTYFEAVSDLEAAVDKLEVAILGSRKHHESLPELLILRRAASRLRLMLSSHRKLFNALARPDFRPVRGGGEADANFRALDIRYERAVDTVENARALVVGSFELYTSRTAQRTSDTVRVLTFATVLLGSLSVIAGVLGMNFPQFAFFATGAHGFWTSIAIMAGFSGSALLLAWLRGWL
jgi:Mg2+ and Co2+ transporter CorA